MDDKSSGEKQRGSLLNEEFLLCFVSTTQAQSSPFHSSLTLIACLPSLAAKSPKLSAFFKGTDENEARTSIIQDETVRD